jgi:hypothetical protein
MKTNKSKINSEFIKRMIVGSDNLTDVQTRFFNGELISDEEINKTNSINTYTPTS